MSGACARRQPDQAQFGQKGGREANLARVLRRKNAAMRAKSAARTPCGGPSLARRLEPTWKLLLTPNASIRIWPPSLVKPETCEFACPSAIVSAELAGMGSPRRSDSG